MSKYLKLILYTAILITLYSFYLLLSFFFHQVSITLRIQTTLLCFLSLYLTILIYNKKLSTTHKQKNLHKLHIMLFIIYISQLCHLLFFASEFSRDRIQLQDSYRYALSQQWLHNTNLTPFYTIQTMISILTYSSYYQQIALLNILGNIIAFAPFAYFLPTLFPKMQRFKYFIWTMIWIISSVEILQFLTLTGSMDIDDFILNLSGAVITYLLYKLYHKKT